MGQYDEGKKPNIEATAVAAANRIVQLTPAAIASVNAFSQKVFQTRGGRIGSGMGALIEGLWGFHLNTLLAKEKPAMFELGWIYGHEYNDFACLMRGEQWDIETRQGELFRIEVKSMVTSADESKAHFDRLAHELPALELLAVFLWDWKPVPDSYSVFPAITDFFIGPALDIAQLRDALHVARGGRFVMEGDCPDDCPDGACTHLYEPLNANMVRERRTGPEASKGGKASYAANFGGMLRMLGAKGHESRAVLKKAHAENEVQRNYLDFMARNFPRVAKSLR